MKTLIFNPPNSLNQLISLLPLLSRLLLASVGSYAIATLSALACLALPIDRISAVYWGYIMSAVVCTVMILLAFSIRNLWQAWAFALIMAGLLGGIWQFGT